MASQQCSVFACAAYWEHLLAEPAADELCARALQLELHSGSVGAELPWMGEDTVLQYALRRAAGPLLVGALLEQWPWLAHVRGDDACLALHTACVEGARAGCVRLVLAANPLAAGARSAGSREPALHLALRAGASLETVALLLHRCPCALMMVGAAGGPLEVAIRANSPAPVVCLLCAREHVGCGLLVCDEGGLLPIEQALAAQYDTGTIAALLAATLDVAPRVFRAMNEGLRSPEAFRLGIFMEPRREARAENDARNVCFYETKFHGASPCDVITAQEMRSMVHGWQGFVGPGGISAARGVAIVRIALRSGADVETLAMLLAAFPQILGAHERAALLPLVRRGASMHALTPVAQAAARAAGSPGGEDLLLLYASLSAGALQTLRRAAPSRDHPCPRIAACEVHSWALFDMRAAWGPARQQAAPHAKQAETAILGMEQRLARAITDMFQSAGRGVRRRLRLQKKGEPLAMRLQPVRARPAQPPEAVAAATARAVPLRRVVAPPAGRTPPRASPEGTAAPSAWHTPPAGRMPPEASQEGTAAPSAWHTPPVGRVPPAASQEGAAARPAWHTPPEASQEGAAARPAWHVGPDRLLAGARVESDLAHTRAPDHFAGAECCVCFKATDSVLQPCAHLCVCAECLGACAPLLVRFAHKCVTAAMLPFARVSDRLTCETRAACRRHHVLSHMSPGHCRRPADVFVTPSDE